LVWSLAYSPDGRRLAIGQQGLDGGASVLRVWDLATKRDLSWFARPLAYRCVVFSPDGKIVAAGTFDGAVEAYKFDGSVATFSGFWAGLGQPINGLVYLPNGRLLAGDWGGHIFSFDSSGIARQTFEAFPAKIYALAASPDNSTLAVAGHTGDIHLYDISSGHKVATLTGHESLIESLVYSSDGKLLASSSWDRTIRLWNRSGKLVAVLKGHERPVLCARFSPDGKILATSEGQSGVPHTENMPCTIKLWSVEPSVLLRTINAHSNSIFTVAFAPDGRTLVSGSMDQTVKFWDPATGRLRETIVPGESGTDSGFGMSIQPGNDPERAGSSLPREPTPANKSNSPVVAEPMITLAQGDKEAWSVAYSPQGHVLVSGGSGSLLRWDLHAVEPGGGVERFEVEKLPTGIRQKLTSYKTNAIAFSPDGKLFATASARHALQWQLGVCYVVR
jgi:WD40 repeat protein